MQTRRAQARGHVRGWPGRGVRWLRPDRRVPQWPGRRPPLQHAGGQGNRKRHQTVTEGGEAMNWKIPNQLTVGRIGLAFAFFVLVGLYDYGAANAGWLLN